MTKRLTTNYVLPRKSQERKESEREPKIRKATLSTISEHNGKSLSRVQMKKNTKQKKKREGSKGGES